MEGYKNRNHNDDEMESRRQKGEGGGRGERKIRTKGNLVKGIPSLPSRGQEKLPNGGALCP